MNMKYKEIDDNEIRVISSNSNNGGGSPGNRFRKPKYGWLALLLCVLVAGGLILVFGGTGETEEETIVVKDHASVSCSQSKRKGYVEKADTLIDGVSLTILTPCYASARLQIGAETLQDTSAVLVVPAADVRKDNGEIVGTFVQDGNLVSKGQAKAGFCAILNGSPVVGISDATAYLEQTIERNGCFFRQYPLVAAGQVVENKPKGKSIRRALAERDGDIFVVMSHDNLTFHDFSQALADMGVANAIYLVGSSAFGFAIDKEGNRMEFGLSPSGLVLPKNANYIVWK